MDQGVKRSNMYERKWVREEGEVICMYGKWILEERGVIYLYRNGSGSKKEYYVCRGSESGRKEE